MTVHTDLVRSLDARYYTDPDIFAAEEAGLFARSWQFAGHISQLERPGDYFTTDVAGESLILLRDRDLEIRCFYNVCQHRAHQLVQGEGNAKLLVCPYHAWTYELTGRLRMGPNIKAVTGFNRDDVCLSSVRVEDFLGFLFVNLDPDAPDMDTQFPRVREELARFVPNIARLRPLEWVDIPEACNWKISIENYSECYHCQLNHPTFAKGVVKPETYDIQPQGRCLRHTTECQNLDRMSYPVDLNAGAVNILCGHGHEAGAALAGHPRINQAVFTGSVKTGIAVATAAARNVVPCVLELGGKSAAIVYDDADIGAFIGNVRWGIYFGAGQVCSAMSRVLVHETIHDRVVDGMVDLAKSLSVGPGIERPEAGLNMGSMVSEPQRDRAADMVSEAQRQGATVAAGGRKLNRPGHFLEPTVMTDVTPGMTIAQEEVFGPVVSVMPFSTEDEAIEIANGTDYGLVSGVFTRDLDRATGTARRMRAGQIFVNEWFAGGVETPFGGYGKSGYGREKGREALWNYVQTKNIAIALS